MQRLHQGISVRKKTMIKVHKYYKLMQLLLKLGLTEISNSLNFVRERSDTYFNVVITEKIKFCGTE